MMTTKTLMVDKTFIELALAVAKCAARATGRRQRKLERHAVDLLNTAAGLGRGWAAIPVLIPNRRSSSTIWKCRNGSGP